MESPSFSPNKADKWEQYEHFARHVLIPAMEKVEPSALRHTRFLHPAEQNEDGTYTSVFLMDPLIEDADYDTLSLLEKAYGKDKAEEYIQDQARRYVWLKRFI